MSEEVPLYLSQKIPSKVNPAKIAPQILSKQSIQTKQLQQNKKELLLQIPRQKKITKAQSDKRKHYRTKMCPHGRQCRKRFTCTFAHTEQELRRPFIRRKNPCILYQKGQCSLGSACRDYHGNIDLKKNYKYKIDVCQQYLQGKCTKGSVCIFKHEDPDKQHSQEELNEEEGQQKQTQQNAEKIQKLQGQEKNIEKFQKIIDDEINKTKNKQGLIKQVIEQLINPHPSITEGGFSFTFQ